MPVLDTDGLARDRIAAIAAFHARVGQPRAELDVSGGVDSALLLVLLSRALGPEHVTAVHIAIHSAPEFCDRARAVARTAGVPLVDLDATALFDSLQRDMLTALAEAGLDADAARERMARDRTVSGSMRSCLRAPIGRGFNRLAGDGIRHGTGNECEDRFLRFYQKGGDGEVDTNPLAMLSKGEVLQLARAVDVPREIRAAVPSPDLHGIGEAHTDEDELLQLTGTRWTYSRVDPDSGEYTSVGTIERTSRLLDLHPELIGEATPDWDALTDAALSGPFAGAQRDEVGAVLRSARALEASTRHKHNPACPTLGVRAELVAAGLITDALPSGG